MPNQMAVLLQQNRQLIDLLAKENGVNLKTKAPAAGMSAQFMHGPTGVFSVYGLEREIISAHVQPMGMLDSVPNFPNMDTDPRFGGITGFSATTGSRPNLVCEDAPKGYIKGCNLTAAFGQVTQGTDTIDAGEIGRKLNRGDFTDLQVLGLELPTDSNGMPSVPDPRNLANNLAISAMVGAGVQMNRDMATHFWQGTPANNTPGGGYKEFPGLDAQIATGQKDADTGALCPALDSIVYNFNYQNVNGSGAGDIAVSLSSLEFQIYHLARQTNMLPATWKIAMHPQLWHELSKVWPILYNTDQVAAAIAAGSNARVFIDGRQNIGDRDEMRRLGRITINGRNYDVVPDDGIYEQNSTNTPAQLNDGEYASSIYMVPETVRGNFRTLYMQHIDYRRSFGMIPTFSDMNATFWTDKGKFTWAAEYQKWCFTLTARTEQRVILRTPQLAGRIDNVLYAPIDHVRDFDPDLPHWKDGGVSLRSAPTKQAVWL